MKTAAIKLHFLFLLIFGHFPEVGEFSTGLVFAKKKNCQFKTKLNHTVKGLRFNNGHKVYALMPGCIFTHIYVFGR